MIQKYVVLEVALAALAFGLKSVFSQKGYSWISIRVIRVGVSQMTCKGTNV